MPLTALLPLAAVDGSAVALLSPRERAYIDRFRLPRRRHEALCARLAGKWAWLTLAVPPSGRGAAAGEPAAPIRLSAAGIAAFPAASYAAVEILPPPGQRHGGPRLWAGGRCLGDGLGDGAPGASISLAHAGDVAGASIAAEGRAGLDIEDSAAGSPALLRQWLDGAELDWIDRTAGSDRSAARRLLTLLWTLKESLFKTGLTARDSVFDVLPARLEIEFPALRPPTRLDHALAGTAGLAFRARSALVPDGWSLHGTARSIGSLVVTSLLAPSPGRHTA